MEEYVVRRAREKEMETENGNGVHWQMEEPQAPGADEDRPPRGVCRHFPVFGDLKCKQGKHLVLTSTYACSIRRV